MGVSIFIFINMIFYPTFKDQAAELQKSFESLPDAALQLFGGSSDFFSPVGFLNSQIFFLMLPLLLGILAISLGSSLLAAEERDSTIESLMARPISRTHLLLHKSALHLGSYTVVLFDGAYFWCDSTTIYVDRQNPRRGYRAISCYSYWRLPDKFTLKHCQLARKT
jgi:ABC-type transport system involved in multi-copper enzyme maturation permease subunit